MTKLRSIKIQWLAVTLSIQISASVWSGWKPSAKSSIKDSDCWCQAIIHNTRIQPIRARWVVLGREEQVVAPESNSKTTAKWPSWSIILFKNRSSSSTKTKPKSPDSKLTQGHCLKHHLLYHSKKQRKVSQQVEATCLFHSSKLRIISHSSSRLIKWLKRPKHCRNGASQSMQISAEAEWWSLPPLINERGYWWNLILVAEMQMNSNY